jgi:hypothetical protein
MLKRVRMSGYKSLIDVDVSLRQLIRAFRAQFSWQIQL